MDAQAILDLMKEMKQSGIESLEWQTEGQTLRLVRPLPAPAGLAGMTGIDGPIGAPGSLAGAMGSQAETGRTGSAGSAGSVSLADESVAGAGATASRTANAVDRRCEGRLVSSPVVGVFFAAPAPDQDPFVAPGSAVEAGAPLGIIEAMKLMNEVASPCSGTVLEVLVENGQRVEYGQPLFVIKENRP